MADPAPLSREPPHHAAIFSDDLLTNFIHHETRGIDVKQIDADASPGGLHSSLGGLAQCQRW